MSDEIPVKQASEFDCLSKDSKNFATSAPKFIFASIINPIARFILRKKSDFQAIKINPLKCR